MKDKKSVILNKIQDRIYTIRGVQVMLDRDLAELYKVETKRVNEAVKNNPDKFPQDFYFELTDKEFIDLRSKFSTTNFSKVRTSPKVFTEQGVYMLATILKSKVATEVTLSIMRTFTKMRYFLQNNAHIFERFERIEYKLSLHDKNFEKIFKGLEDKSLKPKQGIFYESILRDLRGQCGIQSNEIIFFDDDQKNIDEAKAVGIEAYLYNDFSEFEKIIKKL